MAQVTMEDVSKVYGEDVVAGWDMNLDIEGGETVMIVPLVAPGMLTAAILTFTFAWNEFLVANTCLFDDATQPVTVVPNFATVYTVDYGAQAAAVVVTVSLIIIVWIFQRTIFSGLTSGAVKG